MDRRSSCRESVLAYVHGHPGESATEIAKAVNAKCATVSGILNRAWNDYGRYFNQLSCKEWVRKVIYNASGGEMMIPSNQDNCRWLWSQYVSGYNISRDIRYAQPGEIVQMQLRNAPYLHTAIVSNIMADRVGFIDQNWISPGWTVGYHEILFSTFYSGSSITCYSIYTIL